MKQTPIPFSAPMIRAIMTCAKCGKISVPFPCEHCGSTKFVKTQTRRVLRWTPRPDCVFCNGTGYEFIDCGNELSDYDYSEPCRCITAKCHYREGVMLWCKETWLLMATRIKAEDVYIQYEASDAEYRPDAPGRIGHCVAKRTPEHLAEAQSLFLKHAEQMRRKGHSLRFDWRPSIFMPKEVCRLWLIITGTRDQEVQDISEEDCLAEGIRLPPTELFPDINTEDKLRQRYAWLWDKRYAKHDAWKWNPWCRAISFQRTNKPTTETL